MRGSFHLLGSWRLCLEERPVEKLPRRKEQGLLAYLALETGQAHSRELLLGLFWPELDTKAARNNLRVALARLKKYLSPLSVLETSRQWVQLSKEAPFAVDVLRFQSLLQGAMRHPHPDLSECSPCIAALHEAASLYAGPLLEGFFLEGCAAFEEWLSVWRERLQVQADRLLGQLVQLSLSRGQTKAAWEYAQRQVALDPLSEDAHRGLIRSLYLRGMRGAALAQFEKCEQLLRDELGVRPARETIALRNQVEDETLEQPSSRVHAARAPRPPLPRHTTPYFGREEEAAQLRQSLRRGERLLTLAGPGGVGKTRLALQVARAVGDDFADGVAFVALESIESATSLPGAIATSLGATLSPQTQPPQEALLQLLAERSMLIVLDNLEHLLEDAVEFLQTMHPRAARVSWLITSRERLNLQGEELFLLEGLPYPTGEEDSTIADFAAVRLFIDRARRVNKEFRLEPSMMRHVQQICQQVEGLPLGLELAATWAKDQSAEQIAAALVHNLNSLETDLNDVAPRHRSAAAAFAHSWALLSAQQRELLPKLAIFRGGFSLDSAQSIAQGSALSLTQLCYKSLLRMGEGRRYSMHELLRQLSAQHLAPPRSQELSEAHGRYFLSRLREQAMQLHGAEAAQTGRALQHELDNIRQAWRWASERHRFDALGQSAQSLCVIFAHLGLSSECIGLLELAIEAAERASSHDALPTLWLPQLALLAQGQALPPDHPRLAQCEASLQDPAQEAELYLLWSTSVLDYHADPTMARQHLDRAFAKARDAGDPGQVARLYCESGRNYLYDGRFADARDALEEAKRRFESQGDLLGQAKVHSLLAPAHVECYQLGPGLQSDREALRLYQLLDHRTRLSAGHHNLAETYIMVGAYAKAREHIEVSLAITRKQKSPVNEANSLAVYAAALDGLGMLEEAERQYHKAIAAQRMLKLNSALGFSLLDWGAFQHRQGRLLEAELTLEEALSLNRELPHMRLTTQALLAQVYADQKREAEALALVEEIWTRLAANDGAGLPFPLQTIYACYALFQRSNDPRLNDAMALAQRILKQTAMAIEDPEIREKYLNHVPVVRAIRRALSRL